MGAEGELFDPQRMAVVEVLPAREVVEGIVLEVYRSGYAHRDRILSTAGESREGGQRTRAAISR